MGRLLYHGRSIIDINDRTLAHLRVVIMNKLRRHESFALHVPHPGQGTLSLFLSPTTPLVLQFWGGRAPAIDRELIEQMMLDASSPHGLTLAGDPNGRPTR